MSPLISIIIPTYDRPQQLRECLGAVAQLDYAPHRYEVIVVDDGSPHSPQGIVDAFLPQLSIRLYRQTNAGPAAARNTGAKHAGGRFLAFTDDDCRPDPAWLSGFERVLAAEPRLLVGGQTRNGLRDNLYAEATQCLIDFLYHDGPGDDGQPRFFTSNNMALAANLFRELGGFNTAFRQAAGEDRDFCDRWLQKGYPTRFVPDAVVRHYHDLTARAFLRQHMHYGSGARRFRKLRAVRAGTPIRLEPARFYVDLLRFPLRRPEYRRHRVRLVGLLLVAQAASLVGFLRE